MGSKSKAQDALAAEGKLSSNLGKKADQLDQLDRPLAANVMNRSQLMTALKNKPSKEISVHDVRQALKGKSYKSAWTSKLSPNLRPPSMKVAISRSVDGGQFVPVDARRIASPVFTKRKDGSYYIGAYTDHDVTPGREYRYRVELRGTKSKKAIAQSDLLTVKVHDGHAPAEVKGVSTESDTESVTVRWAPVNDPELLGYRVYRQIAGQQTEAPTQRAAPRKDTVASSLQNTANLQVQSDVSKWLKANPASIVATSAIRRLAINHVVQELEPGVTEYVDRDVIEGEVYHYRVVAFDAFSGEGPAGLPTVGALPDMTPPKPARNPHAQPMDGGLIEISWSASRSDDTTAYRIYRSTNGGTPIPVRIADASGELEYVDRLNPYSDDLFAYSVIAYDAANNASPPVETSTVELPDIRPPGKPTVNLLETGDGKVTVHWTAPSDNDVQGFRVIRERADGRQRRVIADGVTDNSFVDTTGLIGGRYRYQVEAFDEVDNVSDPSDPFELRVVGDVDARPPTSVKTTNSRGALLVTWEAIKGYADTGYVVLGSTTQGGELVPVGGVIDDNKIQLRALPGNIRYIAVAARYFNGDVSKPSNRVAMTPPRGR